MAEISEVAISSKHSINPLRSGLAKFKGFVMPTCFEQYQEEIEYMDVGDDDIWVTSYPKSGTTWTQEMVYMIANDFDYEGAKETLDKRFPHLEIGILYDFKGYKQNYPDFECEDYLIEPIELIKKQKGGAKKRLIKTHLPWDLLPVQIRNGSCKAKIIHIFRNPKDACVSYYHHSKWLQGEDIAGNLENFSRTFLADRTCFSPYWGNVLGYWSRRDLPNVLFIRYEDMKRDIRSVIRRVAKFLGKEEIEEGEMERLVEHLNFANMKRNPAVAKNELSVRVRQCLGKTGDDDGSSFIRAGNVGGYKSELSSELINSFDEWIEENLKNCNLKIE